MGAREPKVARDPRWIHDHTITGHIRYTRALGKRWYSSLELYNFVMAQSKVGGQRSTRA